MAPRLQRARWTPDAHRSGAANARFPSTSSIAQLSPGQTLDKAVGKHSAKRGAHRQHVGVWRRRCASSCCCLAAARGLQRRRRLCRCGHGAWLHFLARFRPAFRHCHPPACRGKSMPATRRLSTSPRRPPHDRSASRLRHASPPNGEQPPARGLHRWVGPVDRSPQSYGLPSWRANAPAGAVRSEGATWFFSDVPVPATSL